MISFLDKFKMLIKQYDLLPKLLSILLAVILWANLQNSQIDEITYHIYPEIKNLSHDLIVLEDIQKMRITLRGKKEYIKSINVANIKLHIDLSKPVIGKMHEYIVRIQHAEFLTNIEYFLEKDKLELTVCKIKNRIIPVEPVIIGEVDPQYKRGILLVEPQLVQISGPDIIVDALKSLKTNPININNETQTLHVPVHINIKEFSKLVVVPDIVKLTIPIVPLNNLIHFTIPIEIRNRRNDLKYELKTKKVEIYVKKTMTNIELNENILTAYINGEIKVSNQGSINLPIIIEKKTKVPFEIFTYEPMETEVVISHEE